MPFLTAYSVFGNNPLLNTDYYGDVLKVGKDAQSQNDIKDLAQSQNQKYIQIDPTGMVSLNFGTLSIKDVNKILKQDDGLKLIQDLSGSPKSYYYGTDDHTIAIDQGGRAYLQFYDSHNNNDSKPNTMMNFSNNGHDSNNESIKVPGYDGAVFFSANSTYTEDDGGGINFLQ